jgi:hypothetical protein
MCVRVLRTRPGVRAICDPVLRATPPVDRAMSRTLMASALPYYLLRHAPASTFAATNVSLVTSLDRNKDERGS